MKTIKIIRGILLVVSIVALICAITFGIIGGVAGNSTFIMAGIWICVASNIMLFVFAISKNEKTLLRCKRKKDKELKKEPCE